MTQIINGENAVLGRLASYVAKEAMKGEEMVVLNCEQVIITGNKKNIREKFEEKRSKVGSGQKGPKHSRLDEKIVKRTIRGMLSNHRKGRGKEAYRRIKCHLGVPKEFQESKKMSINTGKKNKFIKVKDISLSK
tara:strand:- start:299 stop:700 length:402 start_codon:yes stop_codon:yes gene_type:complete